jgi:vacuolar-type H+-ATPase subunit E/Vma4
MKSWGSIAAVVAAMAEDAAVEIERLERDADAECAALASQPAPPRPPECETARITAERQIAEAEQDAELGEFSERLEERERWIARVVELAQARLGPGAAAEGERDRLRALAVDGARRLSGASCTVLVPGSVRSWLDERWIAQVAAAAGKRIEIDSGTHSGGCIVVSEDRRWSVDHSYSARSRRSEAQWRAALCRMYDDAVTPSTAESAAVSPTVEVQA